MELISYQTAYREQGYRGHPLWDGVSKHPGWSVPFAHVRLVDDNYRPLMCRKFARHKGHPPIVVWLMKPSSLQDWTVIDRSQVPDNAKAIAQQHLGVS